MTLCVGNLVIHKPISDVCDAWFARLGRVPYERLTLTGVAALCLAGATFLLWRRGYELLPSRALGSLTVLGAMTIASQQWLLVSNVELIHFPQFALLASLLLAGGLTARTAWLCATAAGILDETYQHLVIYAGVSTTYLDYNDMVLNAIGAAWTVLLSAQGRQPRRTGFPSPDFIKPGESAARFGAWSAAVLLLALVVLLWIDPPQIDPVLQRASTRRLYRVLSAPEGFAFAVAVWGAVAWGVSASTSVPQCGGNGAPQRNT